MSMLIDIVNDMGFKIKAQKEVQAHTSDGETVVKMEDAPIGDIPAHIAEEIREDLRKFPGMNAFEYRKNGYCIVIYKVGYDS